jgi:hypothetical protein
MSDNILEMGGGFPGYSTATTEGAAIVMRQISRITKRVTQGDGFIGFMTSYEFRMYAYHQYGNGGGYRDGYCLIAPMLRDSYNDKKPVYWTQDNSWPVGTVSGVQIIPGSAARPAWHLPPLLMPANACGFVHSNLTRETVKRYAPYGFDIHIMAVGGLYIRYKVRRDPDTKELFLASTNSTPSGHVLLYMYSDLVHLFPQPVNPSPYYYSVAVVALQSDDDIPIDLTPQMWHLYHEKHINATITPAHGTELGDGTYVFIVATPVGDRVLTEFTVQGVDHLEDGTEVFTDLPLIYPDPADIPDGYKDGQARYYYGPVHSDVYVTAVAEGIEIEDTIKAGIPQTIQMTSDECLMEEGSWALGDTNLPANVELSISDLGLISLYVPQDVYDGDPGGTYYLNVTFTGYSQTKGLTLLLTLEDSPAYGTVWTAQDLVDGGAVNDIFVDSNEDIYITTAAKVFKTDDDLTIFTELTLTGVIDTALGNIQELADGRLILSDRNGIWIKAVGSDEFIRQGQVFTNWSGAPAMRLAAGPDDNYFFAIHTGKNGLETYIDRFNIADLTTPAARYVNNETMLPFYSPPIRAAENVWCFMVGGLPTAGCALIRYDNGTFTRLIQDILVDTSGVGAGSFTMEDSGRIYLAVADMDRVAVVFKCHTRYSDDAGATWTDPVLATIGDNRETVSLTTLKEGYGVFGVGPNIYRSADAFATTTSVQVLDGTVNVIKMIKYRKLLAGTTGATTNLYLSEA